TPPPCEPPAPASPSPPSLPPRSLVYARPLAAVSAALAARRLRSLRPDAPGPPFSYTLGVQTQTAQVAPAALSPPRLSFAIPAAVRRAATLCALWAIPGVIGLWQWQLIFRPPSLEVPLLYVL